MQNTEINRPQLNPHIKRIPAEIWTEIFRCYCAEDADLHVHPAFSVELDPSQYGLHTQLQTVTRTCGRWREIVFSNQIFWSSFFLCLDYVSEIKQIDYLLEALSRSGTTKLRLEILMRDDIEYTNALSSSRYKVIAALIANTNRWQEVCLELAPPIFSRLVRELRTTDIPPEGYFPNLERLDCMIQIKRTVVDNEPDPKHLFLYHCIFNPCPALTQLSFFNAWTTRTPFDYSRLTSLKLSVFEGSSLSTLLSRCPCLQSLSLEECHILRLDNPGSESEPFCHQSITTLILPTYFPNRFHDVAWADVRFPNLDTLHIIESREGGFQALLDMLIESKCNLQTMKLGELPEKSFRELLAIAPSLKFLTLDSYYLSCIANLHRVFRPLYGTASGTPVPDLCSLKVEIFPSHWRLDLDLVRKARSEPRNQPYPYPAGPAPTLEDADRAAIDSDPEYSGSSSSEPTSDADSEAANESESDDTDSDARSEAEPEADSGAANSNTDETVSDTSSEADSEADSHTPDLQATPGADSEVNRQEEMMTALTEKPQYIAGAFVLLEHLRLMMVSRRKDPTLVRITPKPYVNPPPFDDNADVITHLPAYLLAVDDLGMDVLALVVVELYWNTT